MFKPTLYHDRAKNDSAYRFNPVDKCLEFWDKRAAMWCRSIFAYAPSTAKNLTYQSTWAEPTDV